MHQIKEESLPLGQALRTPSAEEGAGVPPGSPASTKGLAVKLDLWNGEVRLHKATHNTHGAYRPFAAALRDALDEPDPTAL